MLKLLQEGSSNKLPVVVCCTRAEELLVHVPKPDKFKGPPKPGWCIPLYHGGHVSYVNVVYCPFCGNGIGLPNFET